MTNNSNRLLLISVVCLGVAAAVIVNSDPFIRLIPADVLRGSYDLTIFLEQETCETFIKNSLNLSFVIAL